jgi:hypothetical protein
VARLGYDVYAIQLDHQFVSGSLVEDKILIQLRPPQCADATGGALQGCCGFKPAHAAVGRCLENIEGRNHQSLLRDLPLPARGRFLPSLLFLILGAGSVVSFGWISCLAIFFTISNGTCSKCVLACINGHCSF